jgi:hypothetical protein
MTATAAIKIFACVSAGEQPIVEAACGHLAAALSQAAGAARACEPTFVGDLAALEAAPDDAIILTSMLAQMDRLDDPWDVVEQEVRAAYATLCERGVPVMICTILRHVPMSEDRAQVEQLRVRIRRLNLLTIEISQALGAFVIDLDRILADVGALRLQTDFRLGGPAAIDLCGQSVALCLVTNALDDHAPFDQQDAAKATLLKYQPMIGLPAEIRPPDMVSLGKGRRKQTVATVIDTVQENHVGWLIGQVLKRHISPGEAAGRLIQAVRRRGARESAALLVSGVARMIRQRT